jgi:large subunit ribosomal protein L13
MKGIAGYTVIDVDGLILGRLSSTVAKRLLCGEKIALVNADKAVISGKRTSIVREYKERLGIRTLVDPAKGPFHPRRPDRILRRTIRGMLPWDTKRGKEAFARLSTFIGIPPELKKAKLESINSASVERLRGRFVRLAEISSQIGWNPIFEK